MYRKIIGLLLSMVMILASLQSAAFAETAYTAKEFSAISITENKCFYCGEDRNAEPLTVIGTLVSDGSETVLTGNSEIAYSSSDETVFKFDGNKLSSTGKNGMAVISAKYGRNTAKMIMTRQDSKTSAEQPISPEANVSNATDAAYVTSGKPGTPEGGHYDGSALSNWPNNYTVRLMRKSWAKNKDASTVSTSMTERWWDSGYRSMAGWFYDDFSGDYSVGFENICFTDSALFHQNSNFEKDYGYGEFAEKWKGMNSWKAVDSGIVRSSANYYYDTIAEDNITNDIKTRTKGWHQFLMALEKNSDAEYGWSVYTYFDGELIGTKNIVPEESAIPSGTVDSNTWATMEIRPLYQNGYKNYIDDMILMGSLNGIHKQSDPEEEPPETGSTITVFKEDYESGSLPIWNNGKIDSIKDDGTGNHYGAVTLSADGLAGKPAASESDKRVATSLGFRLKAGNNVPYISGKNYTLSWDLGSVNNGNITALSAGVSGIEGMGTNKLLGYGGGTTAKAYNQYYFLIGAATTSGGTAAKQTAKDLPSGWRRNVATGINYKLTTSSNDLTIVPDGTVGSVNNFFFEVSIADTLLKILVDNQAYWGAGFVKDDKTNSPLTGYTFTLDADHVYGDEACIADGTYTKESLVGTEWSLGQDCSGLKSDKRTAAFQKVLDDLNIAFGMDNVEWKAETTYYEDTVNITGDASVTAVTNTGVGCEASEAVANGGKVTVNDYFGTKYEITAESKPIVKYNGVAVEAKAEGGKYVATIPAASVTKNGILDVAVSEISEQMVEIYKEDFNGFAAGALSGGWSIANGGQYYQSGFEKDSTGNTYLVMKDWNADEIVKLFVNKNGNLQEMYPRVQISKPPYKFDIGRDYKLSIKYKYTDKGATMDNINASQIFFNFTGGSVNKWGTGWGTWVPSETANRTQFYSSVSAPKGEDGWRYATAPSFIVEEAYTTRVDGTPIDEIGLGNNQFEFKGLTNGNDINAYPIVKLAKEAVDANTTDGTVDQAAAAKALAASLKEHDYKICLDDVTVTTMAETKKVTVTADEGAEVTVNSKSVASGSKVSVPVDFESQIAVSAKAGYVIDTVTIDGKKQEVAANSTSYNTAYVFTDASSSIAVTTKTAASYEVAVTLGAGGTLKINNKDVKNGDKINVIDGTETTVAVKPDDGKKIDYVKIDGAAKEIPAGGGTIKHTFTKAGTIEVAFKEAGKVEGV
ncbi:MAG: hypothetical protein SPL89_02430, partial [Clostridia bacterium]|nr:hypothetical protein [Clostridia bacterium]